MIIIMTYSTITINIPIKTPYFQLLFQLPTSTTEPPTNRKPLLTAMTVSEPEPPPYGSIDELPAYSNSIHLVSLCRRKLEYRAPNVPARKGTRGWNFYWLVLCGTALNVFQPNQRELKAHLKREAAIRAARLKEHNNRQRRKTNDSPSQYSIAPRPRNVLHPHPHPHPIESFTRTTTPHSSSPPPPSSPSSSPSPSPSAVHKLPFDVACESLDQPLISSEPPPLVIGGKPHPGNAAGPDVRTHKLVKQYAMNGATCVRAYDYLRRYFVLRIRADGQQFMVQLNSYPETLEWLAVSDYFLLFYFLLFARADKLLTFLRSRPLVLQRVSASISTSGPWSNPYRIPGMSHY